MAFAQLMVRRGGAYYIFTAELSLNIYLSKTFIQRIPCNRSYSKTQDMLCNNAHRTNVIQYCSHTSGKLCDLHLHRKCILVWRLANKCKEIKFRLLLFEWKPKSYVISVLTKDINLAFISSKSSHLRSQHRVHRRVLRTTQRWAAHR